MKEKKLTYDSAFAELQTIVEALQSESVGIDNLAEKIARAKELVAFCREKLRSVEKSLSETP